MRRTSSYLEPLARTSLFASCSKDQLRTVSRHAEVIEVKTGDVIVEEGRTGHEFYVIGEGSAVVRRGKRDVAVLGPGDFFGELALLVKEPRNSEVVAETPMKLFVLGEREFAGVLADAPPIARKVMEGLASRLRQADLVTA